jgi:3-deoxy-D-manno-octulosonic-acid transferase
MVMLGYSLLLTLALIVSAPWWVVRMMTTDRYRDGLGQRLGRVPAALREAARDKRIVWLHAVSVGEVLAASRLIGELEAALNEAAASEAALGTTAPRAQRWRVVISTTTRTGQALACERFGAERVFYMPLDFAFCIRPYLRALSPAALLLTESELWPRLLHECWRANVPVAVVNARISDRSFARAMKVRKLWSRFLRMPTLWLAQSDETADRLRTLGVTETSLRATGNLKYDIRAPKESRVAALIKKEAKGRPILVAGSTVTLDRRYEDESVITAWRTNARVDHGCLLVIAPRDPETFIETEHRAYEYKVLTATSLQTGLSSEGIFRELQENEDDGDLEIVILDTVGDLASVYSIADIAFVGGSLVSRGGHNPIEPAHFGVPVIMGPSFENFRDVVTRMTLAQSIRIVNDDVELEAAFNELLSNPHAARAMGERGRAVFESQQGATARTVEAIVAMLRGRA